MSAHHPFRPRWAALLAAAAVAAALLPAATAGATARTTAGAATGRARSTPPAAYPKVGRGTSFLDHDALLGDVVEPQWYEANVPFVDLPDEELEDTYYYRWRTLKEALKYTGPKDGWIFSEFLGPVGYSAPDGGISAAAAHHVYESRWLRDSRYTDDYLDYWLRGSGSGPKPATDGLNENTTDWSHQYSFWVADAMRARAQLDGRWDFAVDRLPELERQWKRWSPQLDPTLGLYWQVPVWDAMEYTASSYQSDDPYHGGEGFRPTLNAYQFGDARAIATLLRKRGDRRQATRWDERASSLRKAQDRYLWDPADAFYKHVMRDDNPARTKLDDREQIGFVPWYFHMPAASKSSAWAQLTDPQGFAAPYGPTTVERRSPWFMHDALEGCCRWSGPSWPYATSQTLTAMANLLHDYPDQPYVDAGDYYDVLRGYALTQRKDGRPYVAEAHHPDEDRWIYDGAGHSEDYNHSTFNDLVLSGLLGIRPTDGRRVDVDPMIPADWDHVAVENVPVRGHNLTVVWDRDGSHYEAGRGLSVWVDGRLTHRQGRLGKIGVDLERPRPASPPQQVDDLANVDGAGYPKASASYAWRDDAPAQAVDGQDFHLDVPTTRWSTYQSPNREDRLDVDLGAPTHVRDVRVSFYDDGGGVRTPDAFDLQYRTTGGTWADLPGQTRTPARPVRGTPTRVVLDRAVRTDALRLVPRHDDGGAVGVTALQAWREEDPGVSVCLSAPGAAGTEPATVRAGRPFVATATVRATRRTRVAPEVTVPRGWTARPLDRVAPRTLRPGRTWTTRWRVTPPADLSVGSETPVRVLARSTLASGRPAATGALLSTRVDFDPADFSRTVLDDGFDGADLGRYAVDDAFGEPAPRLSTEGGRLLARPDGRQSGAVLRAPVAVGSSSAVVVEPAAFGGGDPEDSVFAGLGAGPDDLVAGWYNHRAGTSGVDARVAGRGLGDAATGGCCSQVRWEPGDRFAAVLDGGTLTTWWEHDDRWSLLRTAPVGTATDAAALARWSPALGVRVQAGTLAIDRLTVLGR